MAAWSFRVRWWEAVVAVLATACFVTTLMGVTGWLVSGLIPSQAILATSATLGVAMIFWACWAATYFEAADPKHFRLEQPTNYLRGLEVTVWFPFVILAIPLVLSLANRLLFQGWDLSLQPNLPRWMVVIYFIWLTITAVVSHRLQRRVRRRFVASMRELKVCLKCGYDLRGRPDGPCPECGWLPDQ